MMKSHIISMTKLILQKTDVTRQLEKIKSEYVHGDDLKRQILRENGYPDDCLAVKYSCEKCSDTGFVESERCSCFLRLINSYAIKELNRYANLPDCDFEHFNLDFYRGKTDSKYDMYSVMENNLNTAKNYADNFNDKSDSLLIYGKTGLGKTHISLSIGKKVIEKGYSVAYNSIINYLDKISREKTGKSDGNDVNTEQSIIDVDLLIIDDLGAEYQTPF
jgi:DNA replication protein DnaC